MTTRTESLDDGESLSLSSTILHDDLLGRLNECCADVILDHLEGIGGRERVNRGVMN